MHGGWVNKYFVNYAALNAVFYHFKFVYTWGPQSKPKPKAVCYGESGGRSCFVDLAESIDRRNLLAERDSRPCAHVAQRLGIKNTASQLKDGAKIVSKPLLVFLGK